MLVRPAVQDRHAPVAPEPSSGLFGAYTADVARPGRLAGRWTLDLAGNGVLIVTPPPGYAGVVSGTLFSADSASLRTNLFAQDVCADLPDGRYSWRRNGNRLVLDVEQDACTARRTYFTANEWLVSTGP